MLTDERSNDFGLAGRS